MKVMDGQRFKMTEPKIVKRREKRSQAGRGLVATKKEFWCGAGNRTRYLVNKYHASIPYSKIIPVFYM